MSSNTFNIEGRHIPKLNGYVFCEKLGSGSFADVYKANKTDGSKYTVAIKCVNKTHLSKTAIDNLISEIKILKSLNNENIVKLIDFNWDDYYVYIIMEYCSGGSLWHFIQKHHRLPEKICQRFLQQLVMAMKYLREHSISHFDLKPQNILIASRRLQVLKIGDFGLAQSMTEKDITTAVKGSPLYMAPEIVMTNHYDARADIWSVGIILYECLFGKAPYSSKSIDELISKIKKGNSIKIPFNSSISPECNNFLKNCLQRDLEKRLNFEQFFSHAFVDLKHAPGPQSLENASQSLSTAVQYDKEDSYESAFNSYNEGLKYLVPLLYTEGDSIKRLQIRKRINEYMKRMEVIKKNHFLNVEEKCININLPPPQRIHLGEKNLSELMQLAKTTPAIEVAIDIIQSAELYEKENKYSLALEKYELALGKLLSHLQKEPKGRRRDLLYDEINRWLEQAEHIRQLIKGADNNLAASHIEFDKNCNIQ